MIIVIHLDDVYIGSMIDKLNKSIKMTNNPVICKGTVASYFAEDLIKQKFPDKSVCIMGGYILFHKFADPELMKNVFLRLHYEKCDYNETMRIMDLVRCV